MNVETNAELILQYKLTTKHLYTKSCHLVPIASSTPIRKPLALCAPKNENSAKTYQFSLPDKDNTSVNGINGKVNHQKRKVHNRLKKGKNDIFYDPSSSDEDEEYRHNKKTRKELIIKVGSSRCSKRCISHSQKPINSEDLVLSPVCKKNVSIKRQAKSKQVKEQVTLETEICRKGNDKTSSAIEESDSIIDRVADRGSNVGANKELNQIKWEPSNTSKERECIVEKKSSIIASQCETPRRISKHFKLEHQSEFGRRHISNSPEVNTKEVEKAENCIKKLSPHEIFTDLKENELRNSLDLTGDDILSPSHSNLNPSDVISHKKSKSWLRRKSLKSRRSLKLQNESQKESTNVTENIRPKRIIKKPQEYWLTKSHGLEKNSQETGCIINEGNINIKSTLNTVSSVNKSLEQKMSSNMPALTKDGEIKSSGPDFIKDIAEMEFVEYLDGQQVSAALGWQFSSFKCCVLKIGVNSEVSSKTKHENSHLGGTVMKGKLLFRIKEEEKEMKKGQIFYVPPLTEWKIMNIGKTECIIYYWCGRF